MRYLITQLLSALAVAHGMRIIHRDIKPENVFLMSNGDLKVGDWGVAIVSDSKGEIGAGSGAGTWVYMAPEMFKIMVFMPSYKGPIPDSYDSRVDIWSAGVVAYRLLSFEVPFVRNSHKLKWADTDSELPALPEHVSPETCSIVEKLLHKDPRIRLSAKQALETQYLQPVVKALVARRRFLTRLRKACENSQR